MLITNSFLLCDGTIATGCHLMANIRHIFACLKKVNDEPSHSNGERKRERERERLRERVERERER